MAHPHIAGILMLILTVVACATAEPPAPVPRAAPQEPAPVEERAEIIFELDRSACPRLDLTTAELTIFTRDGKVDAAWPKKFPVRREIPTARGPMISQLREAGSGRILAGAEFVYRGKPVRVRLVPSCRNGD